MIICSCNVLTDRDVRTAVGAASVPVRRAGELFGCFGCSPKCGRCAGTIRRIIADARIEFASGNGLERIGCGPRT